MTADHYTDAGRRLMTDGGRDRPGTVKNATVTAKGVTQREIDGEEREVLRVPISSTRSDREGDRFSKEALEDMADQIKSQQPLVFDDHGGGLFGPGYSARETIGTQFDAEVEEADDGEHELFAFVNPDGSHEEGVRMLKQVRDEKQAIKFSVGFRILDDNDIEDEAGNPVGREFVSSDLMETSRVGIPANPDASLGVTAKGGNPYGMHPAVAQQFGMFPAAALGAAPEGMAAKDVATDGGTDDLRAEVAELRSLVEELREEDEDDDEDEDDEEDEEEESARDDDGDGGEGEEEDDDEDDEEEESAELSALREEIKDLRKSLSGGPGTPDSADTDTTGKDGLPDDGKDAEPDETDDAATEEARNQTAADIARGN